MKRKESPNGGSVRRIKADLSKQVPNNSYSPPLYYDDVKFICRDCGVESVWTADQQRLWYEQWGGAVQSTAVRCRGCRQNLRREKLTQRRHMLELVLKKEPKRAG